MPSKRLLLTMCAASAVTAVVLAGCGGSSSGGTPSAGGSTPAPGGSTQSCVDASDLRGCLDALDVELRLSRAGSQRLPSPPRIRIR